MIDLSSLDSGASSATPVLKASRIGETARIALVRWEQRAMKKDGAEVINARTGKPRQELIIHGLAMAGTDAVAGLGDQQEVPAPGTPVRFILKGKAFSQWIDARKAHRKGKLCVGDVVERVTQFAQQYDANGAPKGVELRTQAEADKVPRGTSLGFYGQITLAEGRLLDPMTVAAEEAFTAWQESQRTDISGGADEFEDEFA